MGIVCIIIFSIITILSGLWYGGFDVLPDFEFSGRNVTELCQSFNRTQFLDHQNTLLVDEITQNNALVETASAQTGDITNATTTTMTTVAPTTAPVGATTTLQTQNWSFDEARILLYYCRVEGNFKAHLNL